MTRKPPGGPTHIVHIGAGNCDDLTDWLDGGAETVLLVEADPQIAARLQDKTVNMAGVRVLEAAVSADTRRRPFRRMNFPELNSFRTPTALKELFPGLRILSQEPLRPVDPIQLIAPLGLTRGGANMLVIEAPGESLGILKALHGAGLLMCFAAIRVQEGSEILYNKAPTTRDIRSFLAEAGFAVEFDPSPDDPDRPHLEAWLDLPALERDMKIAELETALAAERDAIQQQGETLTRERDEANKQAEELKLQADALAAERDAIQQQGEKLTRERDKARQQAETRAGRVDEIKAARDDALKKIEKMRADLAGAWKKVKEERADLKVAQKNLSVALRTQMLREADLKDLQSRYATLLAQKEAQDTLLRRLTASLNNAAEFLGQMGEVPAKAASAAKTARDKNKAAIASDG